MNREETKKAIEVMQAYVDGKPVQYLALSGRWVMTGLPIWNWKSLNFRIKPKPREVWINEDPMNGMLCEVAHHRKESCDRIRELKTVKFVEVLEDE